MRAESAEWAALERRFRTHAPENSTGAGADEESIAACEAELGVRFPRSYRCFLRTFSYANWPVYIYGVAEGVIPGLLVVSNTHFERSEAEPSLPAHLIPISPDGWGNHYCLDTAHPEGDECPVVFWDHEAGEEQTPERTDASFAAWLERMLDEETPPA